MKQWLMFLVLATSVACGHAAKLRPTPKGAVDVEASFGGPIAKVSSAITVPLPLSTVGASYGLIDRLDVDAHAHLTALAFSVAGLDVGTSYLAYGDPAPLALGPAVTVNGRLYGFAEFRTGAAAAYAEVGVTPSYRFSPLVSAYASANALLQWAQTPVVPSLAAGAELRMGQFALQLEGRWYAPFYPSDAVAVDWYSVAGFGAWGPVVNLSYRFGEGAR